ncbi:hypothetical protein STEG23_004825 [Scotinomys teguina]
MIWLPYFMYASCFLLEQRLDRVQTGVRNFGDCGKMPEVKLKLGKRPSEDSTRPLELELQMLLVFIF